MKLFVFGGINTLKAWEAGLAPKCLMLPQNIRFHVHLLVRGLGVYCPDLTGRSYVASESETCLYQVETVDTEPPSPRLTDLDVRMTTVDH